MNIARRLSVYGPLLCAALFAAAARAEGLAASPIGEPLPSIPSDSKDLPWTFKLGGDIGAASVTDPDTGKTKLYNTIALQPEAGIGKFGVGLDLYAYFDSNGNARRQDWDKASDLVSKIWYARWGQKGDPLYARVGGLSNVTLGHGLIMGGYSNRLLYPDVRKTGAQLDVDLGWAGVESMVSDVQRATLMGGRVYVRPMHGTELPLLKGLAFGLTGVTDRNPDANKGTRDDQVAVYGADADLPLFQNEVFSAKAYGDAAVMRLGKVYTAAGSKDNGKGFAAGVGGKLFFFDYRGEMRSVDNNFVPNYFDGYYEVDRSTSGTYKAARIPGTSNPRRAGPLAELYANILNKVRIGGSYESLNNDPLGIYPRVKAELRTDPSLLLGKFSLAALYERRGVDKFKDLGMTRNPNTLMSAELNYMVNEKMRLTAVFKETFDTTGLPVRTTQIRSDVRF